MKLEAGHAQGGACEGKLPYGTAAMAIAVIKRMERRKQTKGGWCSGGRLTAYRCDYCHKWHIGQDVKRKHYG